MKKKANGYTIVELLVVVAFFMVGVVGLFGLYVTGSVIASGVKAATQQCGTNFNVPVVNDDWFCPEEKETP